MTNLPEQAINSDETISCRAAERLTQRFGRGKHVVQQTYHSKIKILGQVKSEKVVVKGSSHEVKKHMITNADPNVGVFNLYSRQTSLSQQRIDVDALSSARANASRVIPPSALATASKRSAAELRIGRRQPQDLTCEEARRVAANTAKPWRCCASYGGWFARPWPLALAERLAHFRCCDPRIAPSAANFQLSISFAP